MGRTDDRLEVRLLGIPRVDWDGTEVRLPSQKALAILCYVAVRRRAATRPELAELLWTAGSASSLRPELHRLRGLRGAERWLDAGAHVAVRAETDLAAFERAVGEGRHAEALEIHPPNEELARGLAPRQAPAFADWLEAERRRTQSLYRDALRGHARTLEAGGDYPEALTHVRHLLDLDPLDESAHRAAMRCEVGRGHLDAALAQFEVCRRLLASELGSEPGDETTRLARAIGRGARVGSDAVLRTPLPPALLRPPRLVGRARAWARLEAAWDAGRIINVSGARGVGKTRLVMDFVRSKGNVFVLEGRRGDELVPYASLARALRAAFRDHPTLLQGAPAWVRSEVGRILPDVAGDVADGAARVPTTDQDAARFFEAQIHLMDRLRKLVAAIVVDDLQDLDARSFEVGLSAQARLLRGVGEETDARMVAVFRPDALPSAFEQGLELAVQHGIAVHVELQPLDVGDVQDLLESLGIQDAAASAPNYVRLTGGNPRSLLETLKHVHEATGALALVGDRLVASATAASLFERRLEHLGPLALRVVRAAAALGGRVDVPTLVDLLDASPAAVASALAELERVQVLREGRVVDAASALVVRDGASAEHETRPTDVDVDAFID